MPLAELPGVRLWYEDTGGDGTPVVLLHAATGSSQAWEHQLPAFTDAGFRCIAYDRRGWGRTESTAASEQAFVADDLQALADHLHLDQFHIVGTAAGGFAALDYVLTQPGRVRSLVVACSMGAVRDEDYQAVLRRIRPPNFQSMPAEFREVGPSYRAANPEGTARWLELEHTSHRHPPEPPQPMRHHVTFASLESIRVPSLMLAGDADLIAPPAVMRLLAARIPNCHFATIPEAGHAAFWEQPAIWNRLVLDFLAQH